MTFRSQFPRSRRQLLGASLAGLLVACGESDAEPMVDYNPGVTGDAGLLDAASDAYVSSWDAQSWWPSDAGGDSGGSDGSLPGDASADGSAGEGGAGDGGAVDGGAAGIGLEGTGLTVFPTSGTALDAPDGKWSYHEFAGTSCRLGTGPAGVTVFRNKASKKLMIFFEGGGACFDADSCGANPSAIDDKDKAGPSGGLFDRSKAENPVKDWNFVYVPYCTGDVFAGTNANGKIGNTAQKFVGYLNSQAFLQRIVPTFKDATDVLVTGVSAGGFGASSNVVLIQRAFPDVKVKLIDDSGPPMSSKVVATCLQKQWRETWGLDQSMLKDCADCKKPDDFTFDYGVYLAKTFNNRLSGLIETQGDGIITLFFGKGSNVWGTPCSGSLIPPLGGIPAADFKAGLLEFRDAVKQYTSFGSFFPAGSQHTWLMGDSVYTHNTGGTKMIDWVADIVNDKGTKHVGF